MAGRGVPQPSVGSLKPRFPGSPPQPAASTSKSSARVLSKGWGEPRRVTLRSLRRKRDGSRGSPPHSHRARFSPACTEKCRCSVELRHALSMALTTRRWRVRTPARRSQVAGRALALRAETRDAWKT
jgi:hypothetical protein